MKKIFLLSVICCLVSAINAQKKFNEKTGKEILKLLPAKMKDKDVKKEKDRVKDAKGFMGVIVHRDYGDYNKNIRVEVINYSPSLISVNAFLDSPVINNPNKFAVTVIAGYKALVQTLYGENSKISYELLLPMSATLLAIRSTGYTRDELIAIANTIPVAAIAKKVAK